jgi:plastocyanin
MMTDTRYPSGGRRQMHTPPAETKTRLIPAVSALALMAVLAALAGCGSSSSTTSSSSPYAAPSSSSAASTPAPTPTTSTPAAAGGAAVSSHTILSLAANPEGQLKYETTSLTAKAGKVSIAFTNMSPVGHNVTVASSSGSVVGATPTFQGGSKTLSLNLKPGTYKFYCSVPGHRQAGMEGTLVVK